MKTTYNNRRSIKESCSMMYSIAIMGGGILNKTKLNYIFIIKGDHEDDADDYYHTMVLHTKSN